MYAEAGTNVEKSCPKWDSNSRPQGYGADALPAEPVAIIAYCEVNAAMRFTANKNVALSASAVAA